MDYLYSNDIREREQAAKRYRPFPQRRVNIPKRYKDHWKALLGERTLSAGEVWPEEIAKLSRISKWPDHAFGTANAACLVIWHRPGGAKRGNLEPDDIYIGPKIPVLGGIAHAHNKFWVTHKPSPSWRNIHKYLPQAIDGLDDPWSQVMIACLNPEHGDPGDVDLNANMAAISDGGRIDRIVSVCNPKVILACGAPVQDAISFWKNPQNTRVVQATHPSARGRYHWKYEGPKIVEQLRVALYED